MAFSKFKRPRQPKKGKGYDSKQQERWLKRQQDKKKKK